MGNPAGVPQAPPVAPKDDPPLPPLTDARPAPLPEVEPASIPWHNHIEVGGGVAIAELPAHLDSNGIATPVRLRPGVGFHFDLSWQLLRYLRLSGYMSEHDHNVETPIGSLGLSSPISGGDAHAYSFGLRLSPVLPIGKRVRLWLTGGVGWGRIQYGRMTVTPAGQPAYTIFERADSFFELPVGLGGSVELIPRWLSLRAEVTGSFLPSQIGDALAPTQAFSGGAMLNPGSMPNVDAYFVQTIGLSLHL